MNSFDLIAALALPHHALVDRRVPKTLLIENGAPTAHDKRCIREEVKELRWLAALKPTTVGVAAYRDPEQGNRKVAFRPGSGGDGAPCGTREQGSGTEQINA